MTPQLRAGIVLPSVIAMLVLIELLAVTTLVLAFQELAVSRARADGVRVQLASRSAAAHVAASDSIRAQSLWPGRRALVFEESTDGIDVQAELHRLSPTLYALRTSADLHNTARAALGLLLNGFDPLPVLAQFPAALNTGGRVLLDGTALVDGTSAGRAPAGWSLEQCRSWLPFGTATGAIASVPGIAHQFEDTTRLAGTPPVLERVDLLDAAIFDRMGNARIDQLIERADRRESGELELAPIAVAGRCQHAAPANWGAPADQTHPCADYFPLVYSAGEVRVRTGSGQGVLIVNGDLLLGPATHFAGLVLVRGRLIMEPGSVIEGAVLTRSAAHSLIQGATIRRSSCAISRALTGAPALNRLVPRPGRVWIPVF